MSKNKKQTLDIFKKKEERKWLGAFYSDKKFLENLLREHEDKGKGELEDTFRDTAQNLITFIENWAEFHNKVERPVPPQDQAGQRLSENALSATRLERAEATSSMDDLDYFEALNLIKDMHAMKKESLKTCTSTEAFDTSSSWSTDALTFLKDRGFPEGLDLPKDISIIHRTLQEELTTTKPESPIFLSSPEGSDTSWSDSTEASASHEDSKMSRQSTSNSGMNSIEGMNLPEQSSLEGHNSSDGSCWPDDLNTMIQESPKSRQCLETSGPYSSEGSTLLEEPNIDGMPTFTGSFHLAEDSTAVEQASAEALETIIYSPCESCTLTEDQGSIQSLTWLEEMKIKSSSVKDETSQTSRSESPAASFLYEYSHMTREKVSHARQVSPIIRTEPPEVSMFAEDRTVMTFPTEGTHPESSEVFNFKDVFGTIRQESPETFVSTEGLETIRLESPKYSPTAEDVHSISVLTLPEDLTAAVQEFPTMFTTPEEMEAKRPPSSVASTLLEGTCFAKTYASNVAPMSTEGVILARDLNTIEQKAPRTFISPEGLVTHRPESHKMSTLIDIQDPTEGLRWPLDSHPIKKYSPKTFPHRACPETITTGLPAYSAPHEILHSVVAPTLPEDLRSTIHECQQNMSPPLIKQEDCRIYTPLQVLGSTGPKSPTGYSGFIRDASPGATEANSASSEGLEISRSISEKISSLLEDRESAEVLKWLEDMKTLQLESSKSDSLETSRSSSTLLKDIIMSAQSAGHVGREDLNLLASAVVETQRPVPPEHSPSINTLDSPAHLTLLGDSKTSQAEYPKLSALPKDLETILFEDNKIPRLSANTDRPMPIDNTNLLTDINILKQAFPQMFTSTECLDTSTSMSHAISKLVEEKESIDGSDWAEYLETIKAGSPKMFLCPENLGASRLYHEASILFGDIKIAGQSASGAIPQPGEGLKVPEDLSDIKPEIFQTFSDIEVLETSRVKSREVSNLLEHQDPALTLPDDLRTIRPKPPEDFISLKKLDSPEDLDANRQQFPKLLSSDGSETSGPMSPETPTGFTRSKLIRDLASDIIRTLVMRLVFNLPPKYSKSLHMIDIFKVIKRVTDKALVQISFPYDALQSLDSMENMIKAVIKGIFMEFDSAEQLVKAITTSSDPSFCSALLKHLDMHIRVQPNNQAKNTRFQDVILHLCTKLCPRSTQPSSL